MDGERAHRARADRLRDPQSPLWQVRQFLLFRDMEQPDLWLGTDGHGRWGELNAAHRPELDGALDVTIAGSPFVHSIPIRACHSASATRPS